MPNANQNNTLLYDFQNGCGEIPAHRHANGGGWVADTAHIDDTAYIGENARVFGHAKIKDYAVISGDAEVSGYATVQKNACIKGNAVIRGTCIIEDSAEVSDNVFIASQITISGDTVLNKKECLFSARDCMKCPALMNRNYGGGNRSQCLYCLEKLEQLHDLIHGSDIDSKIAS